MIELPIDKAIIAVESDEPCTRASSKCCFNKHSCLILCKKDERQDGKNVYFKLVDYKEGVK